MRGRRSTRKPRRGVDDDDGENPYTQYEGINPTIVAFPDKQRASIIEYSPNNLPAAFPSIDWLELNGLPLPVSIDDRRVPTRPLGSGGTPKITSPPVKSRVEPHFDNPIDFGRNVDRHNSNNINQIWDNGSVQDNNDRHSISKKAVNAVEVSETDRSTRGGAVYLLPAMDTSDEEDVEQRQVQWSDIPPSLQARICVNLAATNQVNTETAIQVLTLNSVEAELALRYCTERGVQLEEEDNLSKMIIRDQLNALLRQDGVSKLREDQEEQLQIFERHFQSRRQLPEQDYLTYSVKDLARAEKYLLACRLDVHLARMDFEATPGHDHSSRDRHRATQSTRNIHTGLRNTTDQAVTFQPAQDVQSQTQQVMGLDSASRHSRKPKNQTVRSASDTRPSKALMRDDDPLIETAPVGYKAQGRRKGLRTGRERKMTEKAREAIESGMVVPGGKGISNLPDHVEQGDEDYVPDDAGEDFDEHADATTGPDREPSPQRLKIKLKFNDRGEAILRKQESSKPKVESDMRLIRNAEIANRVNRSSHADGRHSAITSSTDVVTDLMSKTGLTHRHDHRKQSPVVRQVVSRQGSPTRAQFSRMTHKELSRAVVELTEETSDLPPPSDPSRTTDSEEESLNDASRRTSITIPPTSAPLNPRQLPASLKAPINNPTALAETPSRLKDATGGKLPRSPPQVPRTQPNTPLSVPMTQQLDDALSAFEDPNQIRRSGPNYQVERPVSSALTCHETEKHYEQFTFPFVELANAQAQLEQPSIPNEEDKVGVEIRRAPKTMAAAREQIGLSRSASSEVPEPWSDFDLPIRSINSRSCSEPPQTPVRTDLLLSPGVRRGVSQVYWEMLRSTTSSKTLSNDPDKSESTPFASGSSAELPETPTPMPRASNGAVDEQYDNAIGSLEAKRLPKTPSGNSRSLTGAYAYQEDRHSSGTDGWQPESIAIAEKAGLLVGNDAGRSSLATNVTLARPGDRLSSPTGRLNLKASVTRRKNKLQLSSETGELIDRFEEKTMAQPAGRYGQLNSPQDARQVTHSGDSNMVYTTLPEDQPTFATGNLGKSPAANFESLDGTTPEISFGGESPQDVSSDTPLKAFQIPLKTQWNKTGSTVSTITTSHSDVRSSVSSPDPIQKSSPSSLPTTSKRKASTQKRAHCKVSPATTGMSPPRKLRASAQSSSPGLEAQTAELPTKTLVSESNPEPDPNVKPKLGSNAHRRTRSNVSSSSSTKVLPPAKTRITSKTETPPGKARPTSKTPRSSSDATLGKTHQTHPDNEQPATATNGTSFLNSDNSETPSSQHQSKTNAKDSAVPVKKEKTKKELMAKTKATPEQATATLSSPVAKRTRGRKAAPESTITNEEKTENGEEDCDTGRRAAGEIEKNRPPTLQEKAAMGKAKTTKGSRQTAKEAAQASATQEPSQGVGATRKISMVVRRSGRRSERVEIND